jgi:hypothetical protein
MLLSAPLQFWTDLQSIYDGPINLKMNFEEFMPVQLASTQRVSTIRS